jgi:hypothetical protein
MSKIERGKLALREQLEPMSESKNTQTTRVLRDDELDAVSGGFLINYAQVEFE